MWKNIPVVTNYFSHVGVPLIIVNENSSPFVNDVVNFSTGTILPESSLLPTNLTAAIPKLPVLHMQLGTANVGTQDLHEGSHTKVHIGYRRSYSIGNNKQASSLIPSSLLK